MCGRFALSVDSSFPTRFGVDRLDFGFKSRFNIFPDSIIPTITSSNKLKMMKWGLIPPWSEDGKSFVINSRFETITEKPLFKKLIDKKRCLIPTTGYYEWQKADNKKNKFSFSSGNHEPLYLAGLYLRSSHDKLPFFTILTRDATAELKGIHARMPVILPKDRMMDWLSPEKDYKDFLSGTVRNLHFEGC